MFGAYRAMLSAPGARPLVAVGWLARMPRAMIGLGLVGLVSGRHGSYGLAGAVCSTFVLANAVISPWVARAVDRYGQRRAAVPALMVSCAGLVTLVACGVLVLPGWVYFPAAVTAGTLPNVDSMLRARWSALYRDDPRLHTAFSLESVAENVTFVAGPILALCLATGIAPEAGVLSALACALVGTLALTGQRATEPALAARHLHTTAPSLLRNGAVWVLCTVFVGVGAVFGSLDVTCVAYGASLGHKAAASLALVCLAVGSTLAGLVMGGLQWRSTLRTRLLLSTAVFALLLFPLFVVDGLPALGAVLLLSGMFASPSMITANSLVQRLVPAVRLNEGLSWLLSGLSVGISAGDVLAGWAIDTAGPHAAFVTPVACAVFAALAVAAGWRAIAL
ncbi:MFS transporter [Streptomyces noursei]|uniref:MFS transporter n=1 Tax=Streptomyces noursei TaxID=1971 RepID=UPI0019642A80|nr:MFS transporter [Streptomyces noursei]QRX95217.1 MFS transporter [Streptomyces noursei]